jgi:hypothetical protein
MKRQEFIDAVTDAGWVPRNDAQFTRIGFLWKKLFPKDAEIEFLSAEADSSMLLKRQRDKLMLALEPFAIFACEITPGEDVCTCHNCRAKYILAKIKEGA